MEIDNKVYDIMKITILFTKIRTYNINNLYAQDNFNEYKFDFMLKKRCIKGTSMGTTTNIDGLLNTIHRHLRKKRDKT